MTPALALRLTVRPVMAWLDELGIRNDPRAAVLLLTIAGQESGWRDRRQMGGGPARGLWQFERNGGVKGVLTHDATRATALTVCAALLVPATPAAVHAAIEQNDALACAFARLLLWSDPRALPGESEEGWQAYLWIWRPGKPKPDTWPGHWAAAIKASSPNPR